jgi:hypothetical protein
MGQPSIMWPRGTLVDFKYQWDATAQAGTAGGTLNPSSRVVTQNDVNGIFLGVRFDSNGKAAIGAMTNACH